MRVRAVVLAAALLFLIAVPASAQRVPVDTALVLAVDASGSIDAEEFRLQKEGIAGAVTDAQVLAAIRASAFRRLAIAYVEWGAPMAPQTVVGWMIVEDDASARRFAAAVLAAPRSLQSYNAIGDAIDHAAVLLANCGCAATRSVIDISGDNADMRSRRPAPQARDAAVAAGITVNALAILENERLGPGGRPWLVEVYERTVIGGPGAFVEVAKDRADFARALRRKMVLEIAGGDTRNFAAAE